MERVLQAFDSAAQDVEALLNAILDEQGDPVAIAEWISHARAVADQADSLIASALPLLSSLKSEPGIVRYRSALALLADRIQLLQQRLCGRQAALTLERERAGRVRAWAAAVSEVVESSGI